MPSVALALSLCDGLPQRVVRAGLVGIRQAVLMINLEVDRFFRRLLFQVSPLNSTTVQQVSISLRAVHGRERTRHR